MVLTPMAPPTPGGCASERRAAKPGSKQTYSFTTINNEMSFGAFTDSHIGARISTSWGMADYMDLIAQDLMDNTDP